MTSREDKGSWADLVVPALSVMFGMQVLRTLLPLLVYGLRDRVGWTAVQLGLLALAVFATAFLAAPLWRVVGIRGSLLATAGGLGLLRLVMQIWRGDPLITFGLVLAATVLFVLFLPTYLLSVLPRGPRATARYGVAVLLGFAVDTALHGVLLTWDLVWRDGLWTIGFVALLVVVQIGFVARGGMADAGTAADGLASTADGATAADAVTTAAATAVDAPTADGAPSTTGGASTTDGAALARGVGFVWLAIGPVLALALLQFENISRLAALGGWRLPPAYDWMVLTQVAGIALATWAVGRVSRRGWFWVAGAGVGLVGLTIPALGGATLAAFQMLAGQLAFALLVAALFSGLGAGGATGCGRLSPANGVGMILFVLLLFLTYSGYDIALPLPAAALPPVAAAILALCAVIATRGLPAQAVDVSGSGARRSTDWYPALAAALLLILPGVVVTTVRAPAVSPLAAHDGVRVMTFNIHNGFDTQGWLGLEAIARTIEQQQPDVVALQEAARGWVIDGSTDMLSWLSLRLGMPFVWDPTAGPLWGNAILSRFPITVSENQPLPTADLLLRRGFIRARLDIGGGQTLDVLATHYHHLADGSAVRVQESQVILDAWAGAPRTVIAGDMNAVPGDPEIEMLRTAGLVEAVALAGLTPGYTFDSTKPYQRIDYIWLSPDLVAMSIVQGVRDVVITTGGASDHLGIAATLAR